MYKIYRTCPPQYEYVEVDIGQHYLPLRTSGKLIHSGVTLDSIIEDVNKAGESIVSILQKDSNYTVVVQGGENCE